MANPAPSESSFDRELEAKHQATLAIGETKMTERLAWSTRKQRYDWGKVAETNLKTIFNEKAENIRDAIKLVRDKQLGEVEELEENRLLHRYDLMIQSFTDRFDLMMVLAARESETQSDTRTSNPDELLALRERSLGMIRNIDEQSIIYNMLPEKTRDRYLEIVGATLKTDFFNILEKIRDESELEELDWKILVGEIKKLSVGEMRRTHQTQVMLVVASLGSKQRFTLAQKLNEDPEFGHFGELLVTLVGSNYLTQAQAVELMDQRVGTYERLVSASKGREKKDWEAKLASAETLKARVTGKEMQETQAATEARLKEGRVRMTHMQYGHFNRAQRLLTVRGIGSALLSANGALTMAVNGLMYITSPVDMVSNPAFWIGAAQLGVGLEWSHGFEGLIPTPIQMAAGAVKDRNDAQADDQAEYEDSLRLMVNNRPPPMARFYANYAEHIVKVYEAKRPRLLERKIPITLEELGIKKQEDLPEAYRELWNQKADLERMISDWAAEFYSGHKGKGARKTGHEQMTIIQNAREADGLSHFALVDLPPPLPVETSP